MFLNQHVPNRLPLTVDDWRHQMLLSKIAAIHAWKKLKLYKRAPISMLIFTLIKFQEQLSSDNQSYVEIKILLTEIAPQTMSTLWFDGTPQRWYLNFVSYLPLRRLGWGDPTHGPMEKI